MPELQNGHAARGAEGQSRALPELREKRQKASEQVSVATDTLELMGWFGVIASIAYFIRWTRSGPRR